MKKSKTYSSNCQNNTSSKKTDVVFLINEREKGDLFAFFPNEKYNATPGLFTCYSHIGQHSACHIDYANESRLALPEEYKDLKEELEKSIGYDLNLIQWAKTTTG